MRDQLNIEDQAAREAKKKAEENTSVSWRCSNSFVELLLTFDRHFPRAFGVMKHCPYDQRPRNLKPFKSKISRNQHIKKQHRQVARCPGCGQRLIRCVAEFDGSPLDLSRVSISVNSIYDRQGDEENHHQCQGPSTSGRIVIVRGAACSLKKLFSTQIVLSM